MSTRLFKLVSVFLICLITATGVSIYQFLQEHQRTRLIKDYRSQIPQIAQATVNQVLEQRGLFRVRGEVHSAPSIPVLKNSSENCYSDYITASLKGEKASVILLDLHNCSKLARGQDCRAGGQICISIESPEVDDVYITFDLMNERCGKFTITLPTRQKSQREVQQVFEQFVEVSRMADRESLNALLYALFSNAQQGIFNQEARREFLVTLLGAVHHYLATINIFEESFVIENSELNVHPKRSHSNNSCSSADNPNTRPPIEKSLVSTEG